MKDPHKILGVEPNATPEEIKKAYKVLCQKHHPDKEGGDDLKFKEIQEAFSRINNPEKFTQPQQGHHHNRPGFGQGFNQQGFDFADFFPVQFTQQITLEEALSGCKKVINIPGVESFNFEIPKCKENITIQGMIALPSGKQKRIICNIVIQKHPVFEIQGLNLKCTKEISLLEYYTGCSIQLKTLDKKTFNVKIAPNKPNQIVRMSNKGLQDTNWTGDLLIEIRVKLPVLSESQIEGLRHLIEDKPVETINVKV